MWAVADLWYDPDRYFLPEPVTCLTGAYITADLMTQYTLQVWDESPYIRANSETWRRSRPHRRIS